jgi:unsaturated rhamnogalacturonyl hydrolase
MNPTTANPNLHPMRKLLFVTSVALAACDTPQEGKPTTDRMLVVVRRNYDRPAQETVTVTVDWSEITERLPQLNESGFSVTDQHFRRSLESRLLDTNDDGNADVLSVTYPFASAEPQYTMMISASPDVRPAVESGSVEPNERLTLTYLDSYASFATKDTVDWPTKILESSLNFYPDPKDFTIISPGEWTYEHGMFLNAGFELWQRTGRQPYFDYVKYWLDRFLTPEGTIREDAYDVTQYRLDDILPGRLCLFLYEETGDARYKTAADQLIHHLENQPKTSEGGYWHKEIYPYQMWLDGIYMADVFSMQYAGVFNKPEWYDEAILQIQLISKHTRDTTTGLMYHGWDESKNPVWADSVTGASPTFWSRAIGWYFMGLADCLGYLPEDHPERPAVLSLFGDLAESLVRYQDDQTKLWYQVTDKVGAPDNWIETSSSAMFAYGFARGANNGWLDASYRQRAFDAFNSIIRNYTWYDEAGNLYLDQTVKVGTLNPKVSKGDYAYYVGGETRINDYKGLGALLYASLALSEETGE